MSDGLKALKYAEDNLGVHKCYEDALAARNRLDEILTDLDKAKDSKRDLEIRSADREQEIIAQEWAKHPDMAQTRMDKHLKSAYWRDDAWRELRDKIGLASSTIDGLEYDREATQADLKIAVARMQELGGYFQFLAAIKASESAGNSESKDNPA